MAQTNAEVLIQRLEDKVIMFISFLNTGAEVSTAITVRCAKIYDAWLCQASAQVSALVVAGNVVTLTHAAGVDGTIAVVVDPLL